MDGRPGEPVVDETRLAALAFDFAVKSRAFTSMSDVSEAVYDLISPLGLTAAASGLVSGPKASSGNPFHFTTWKGEWMAHYMAEDFLLADPAPRWARNSGVGVTWKDLIERLSPRDPGRKVIESALPFGYSEGIIIPMRSGGGAIGLVVFGGERGPLNVAEQVFLTIVARMAFESAERIEHDGDIGRAAAILSAREIECLALLVSGHTDGQIGALLGVTHRTVRFHLTNARDKLGAKSRTHLASLALAQGYGRI